MSDKSYQPRVYRDKGGDRLVVASGGAIEFEAGGIVDKIYVDPNGDDTNGTGTILSPVATVTKALTLVTAARKIIFIQPGAYVEAASLTWPNVNEIQMIGLGDVVISGPITTAVLTISPTFTSTTFEAYIKGVNIKHTAQTGLDIDNTNMTRKLLIGLDDVSFEAVSTGDSIQVTHTTAGQAIRIYGKNCDEVEGLVHFIVANANDRLRFYNSVLIGGINTNYAVAGEVTLIGCVVLTNTLGTHSTNVLTNVGCVYRTDAGVYTQLTDAYSA